MKFLLLVLVIAVALWMLGARRRRPPAAGNPPAGKPAADGTPTPMLACAHCGLHLPQADAVMDATGRPFCTQAHRLAGPR